MFSSSVEYHAGLSSGGIEDPVVRAGLGSQVRLVLLQLAGLVSHGGGRGGRGGLGLGLRLWRGGGSGGGGDRLFLDWCRSRGGSFLLHLRLADLGLRCW